MVICSGNVIFEPETLNTGLGPDLFSISANQRQVLYISETLIYCWKRGSSLSEHRIPLKGLISFQWTTFSLACLYTFGLVLHHDVPFLPCVGLELSSDPLLQSGNECECHCAAGSPESEEEPCLVSSGRRCTGSSFQTSLQFSGRGSVPWPRPEHYIIQNITSSRTLHHAEHYITQNLSRQVSYISGEMHYELEGALHSL